jgi:hypothetical protein
MDEAIAALIGALIGAVAGIAGGSFGALAALRASQIAARTPLAHTLHQLGNILVKLHVTKGTNEYEGFGGTLSLIGMSWQFSSEFFVQVNALRIY